MENIPGTESPFGWGVCGSPWLCHNCEKWGLVLKNLELQAQECGLLIRAVGTDPDSESISLVVERVSEWVGGASSVGEGGSFHLLPLPTSGAIGKGQREAVASSGFWKPSLLIRGRM